MNDWKEFLLEREKQPPEKLLIKAIKYARKKSTAIDLGAGALIDALYLLKNGFKKVYVLDKCSTVELYVKKINDKRLVPIVSFFQDYKFGKYDFINAQYSLPFMRPKEFFKTFERIKKAIKKEGIITGQFFGIKDEWRYSADLTFLTKIQAKKVLKGLDIIYFKEKNKRIKTTTGQTTHRHVFHFIARKI